MYRTVKRKVQILNSKIYTLKVVNVLLGKKGQRIILCFVLTHQELEKRL